MDMPVSANIVVDQFGYRPAAEKFAVLRKPVIGFDAPSTFAPGSQYAVLDAVSGQTVITGAPSAWNSGATDGSDLSALPTGTSGSIDWTKYQSASGDQDMVVHVYPTQYPGNLRGRRPDRQDSLGGVHGGRYGLSPTF